MKITKSILLAVLLAVPVSQTVMAQRTEDLPGYFDLRQIEAFVDQETTLEVNVKGALLRMAAEAARIEDESLYDLLIKLRAVHVRGYTLDRGSAQDVIDPVGELARRLADQGWDRVVRVREDDEFVEMLVRDPSGERIEGMLVFVINQGENETIFVNIVGEIDPEDIGRIGRRFRIRVLETL